MAIKIDQCLRVCVFACFLLSLLACGGGGGSFEASKPNSNDNSDSGNGGSNNSSNSVNPSLPGKLFYQEDGAAYVFDFASGESERLPNTNWENQIDVFPSNEGTFAAYPMRSGEQWTVVIDQCGLATNGGCMAIQDKFGNYIGNTLRFNNKQAILAQLTDDAKYIYMRHKSNNGEKEWAAIYDVQKGDNLGVLSPDNANMDWLPDNRLAVVDFEINSRQFRFTRPLSFEAEIILELPREVTGNGTIGGFEVSPDGKYIAFRLDNESAEKRFSIWTIEIESGALVRVAEAGENINSASFPRWSPDGEYLALMAGPRTSLINFIPPVPTPGGVVLKTSMFIFPLNKLGDKPFIFSQFSDKSPEVFELLRVNTSTGKLTNNFHDFGGYSWIE